MTSSPAVAARTGRRTFRPSQELVVLLVTLVLAILFAVGLPGFATFGNLVAMARSVSILGILAIAMSIVVIGRGLDLSLIASMSVTSALTLQLMQEGWATPAAIALSLALAAAIGVINGFIIAFVEVPALFATLATGFIVFGLGRVLLLKGVITYLPSTATGFAWIGQGQILGVPAIVAAFLLTALIVHLLLSRTAFGRFVYAHGDNAEAARLTGISVRRLTMLEYGAAAMIGFLAGLMMAAATASMSTQIINSTLIFDVIMVVVLGGVSLVGGRGSIFSVLVGTALIGTLLNGMTILNLNNNLQDIVKGVVLLAAIILDNRLHPRDEETARQGD